MTTWGGVFSVWITNSPIKINSSGEIKQQLDPLCCVSLCPRSSPSKASATPCYRAEGTGSLQGICHKCTSDFVIHSKTDCLHTYTQMQRNLKCAYFLKFIQSLSLTHTHRQSQQTHSHSKVCPTHELSKWLSQLQQTKLFSFESSFSSNSGVKASCLSIHKPAVVCPSVSNRPSSTWAWLRLSVTSLWAG